MKVSNTAQRLHFIMTSRNLKQIDILNLAKPYCEAYHIKLGRSDLSQFVNGKTEPGQSKLTILGLALGVSEAWLMGWDVPMERDTSSCHPSAFPQDMIPTNTIRIAGRDGSFQERKLTDEQIDLVRRMIDQMPDFED